MQPRFITMLSLLLDSEHIDVSYFAAGIAAHLLSDGPQVWTEIPDLPPRSQLLDQLAQAVANWQTPTGEMVAYRSFQPFFPLLRCADAHPVQLWAVWAIHHVCTKNRKFSLLRLPIIHSCCIIWQSFGLQDRDNVRLISAKRYCGMLAREGGGAILASLAKEEGEGGTQPNVRTLCLSVLEALATHC